MKQAKADTPLMNLPINAHFLSVSGGRGRVLRHRDKDVKVYLYARIYHGLKIPAIESWLPGGIRVQPVKDA